MHPKRAARMRTKACPGDWRDQHRRTARAWALCAPSVFAAVSSGGLAIDGGEIYTFSMTGPDSELSWDIARAQELLAQRPRKPKKLDPVELADWLQARVTITPRHLDHIPVAKRGVPGIFVVITVAPEPVHRCPTSAF